MDITYSIDEGLLVITMKVRAGKKVILEKLKNYISA